MRTFMLAVLPMALIASIAMASDHCVPGSGVPILGARMPQKVAVTFPPNVPSPQRQGGDTIETATVIASFPYNTTGTTTGYTNDYDEVCPYAGSTSPDVVYTFTAGFDYNLVVDLVFSDYDTKAYLYDSQLSLIACNDDYYFDET